MAFSDDFRSHLEKFQTAPFMFVGSGFTRRYAGTEDWVGLLTAMAEMAGKSYARYAQKSDGDLPKIATLLAKDFQDVWWDRPEFEAQRAAHPTPGGEASPLKIAISERYLSLVDRLPQDGPLNDELEALRVSVLEGIITTNYDTVLEYVFPDFAVYVGQDELLFQDPFGVAEIYKIHGSASQPESLVITSKDFQTFNDRNPYLAAKLLTIFVEHPMIFIGYSLTDDNVRSIIMSIASVLTNKNLDQLKDRLIFVDWDESVTEPTMVPSNFAIGGQSIPIQLIRASTFLDVFEVLGSLKRRFPARVLRHLRQELYELVRTSKPTKTVVVSDLEADTDVDAVDVVIGVGVTQRLAAQGIVGLSRRQLLEDVLKPKIAGNRHEKIVQEALPRVANVRTHAPIYRYLRGAGYLADDGSLIESAAVPASVRARLRLGAKPMAPTVGYFANRAKRMRDAHPTLAELTQNAPLSDALLTIPSMKIAPEELEDLRVFLLAHAGLLDSGKGSDANSWVKCVCYYDYLANRKSEAEAKPAPVKAASRPRSATKK